MIKSKRFIIIVSAMVIFCIATFVFNIDALKFGGGLAAIITPYIAGQSYRSSNDN